MGLMQHSQNNTVEQVCIASDVQSDFLLLNYQRIEGIMTLNSKELRGDIPLITLRGDQILLLTAELYKIIDELLSKRKRDPKRMESIMSVRYRDVDIALNVRDSQDSSIMALIDILDMCLLCNRLSGALTIYNRTLIDNYHSLDIVNYLRVHYHLSIQGILDGLQHVDGMSLGILESGLDYLQRYGFVAYDRNFDVYKLTARGYLLY